MNANVFRCGFMCCLADITLLPGSKEGQQGCKIIVGTKLSNGILRKAQKFPLGNNNIHSITYFLSHVLCFVMNV